MFDAAGLTYPTASWTWEDVRAAAKKLTLDKNGDGKSEQECRRIYISGLLHDIGKIGVAESVLGKPEKLTAEEYRHAVSHCEIGERILSPIVGDKELLGMVRHHHERFDGYGYPNGLRDYDIPKLSRILSVADVYDALISRRIYKPPYPHEESVDIIREASGTHFDPDIVDAFLALADQFNKIAQKYADSEEDVQKKWAR
jgi:putative two-component system response regulator